MHLIEVERKRKLTKPDTARLLLTLKKLGYVQKNSFTETDTYFSRGDIDYLKTVECLRVRQRDGFSEITYKPPTTIKTNSLEGITSKRELNVVLADMNQADLANELLEVIGLIPLVVVRKDRVSFSVHGNNDITISLDTIKGAGAYVEVEIMTSDVEQAQNKLIEIESELGVENNEVIDIPYRDIVLSIAGSKGS
jgi:adenylate cyclase class 2